MGYIMQCRRVAAHCVATVISVLWPLTIAAQSPRASDTYADLELSKIGSVRELTGDMLLVSDMLERQLYLLNLRTHETRRVGRVGTGPGEYRQLLSLIPLSNDSTLVEDRVGRRWLLLSSDRIVRTVSTVGMVSGGVPVLAGGDRFGRLLDVQGFRFVRSPNMPFAATRLMAESLLVLVRARNRRDPGRLLPRIDTIARIRGAAAQQTRAMRSVAPNSPAIPWILENPLVAEEQVLLFTDGWIALVLTDPYRVEWITPQGVRIRGGALPFSNVPITSALKRQILRARFPGVVPEFSDQDLPPWPKSLPAFLNDALTAMPDGSVAVRRASGAAENVYDVVGRDGRLKRRLTFAGSERLVGAGERSLYTATRDADDVEVLKRISWPP